MRPSIASFRSPTGLPPGGLGPSWSSRGSTGIVSELMAVNRFGDLLRRGLNLLKMLLLMLTRCSGPTFANRLLRFGGATWVLWDSAAWSSSASSYPGQSAFRSVPSAKQSNA
eukprot:4517659-Pyramimonas_sp.AAC.1